MQVIVVGLIFAALAMTFDLLFGYAGLFSFDITTWTSWPAPAGVWTTTFLSREGASPGGRITGSPWGTYPGFLHGFAGKEAA